MQNITRRNFVKAATITGAAIPAFNILGAQTVNGLNTSKIKVGLIGCGGRGKGALKNFLQATELLGIETEIVAVCDAFQDRLNGALQRFELDSSVGHYGFDAYHKVANSDAEVVLMATPPNFRPVHFKACIEAGKHCFIEKPVAVDPAGVRSVMETGELAAKKGLSVVAGTQRRHQQNYLEMIAQVEAGAIGDVVGGAVYWNMGTLWTMERKPDMDNRDFLARNWLNFTEMSGDHIVEQHVHQLDVMNWIMGRPPRALIGYGGCARREVAGGNQFDFFNVDFDFGDGVHIHSQCRQIADCYNRVGETFRGTEGYTNGPRAFGKDVSIKPVTVDHSAGMVQEHVDLLKGIRGKGGPINRSREVAEATLLAVGGRMAAYTGKLIRWSDLTENADSEFYNGTLAPAAIDFEKGDVDMPDMEPAVPGAHSDWKVLNA
ncbi:oxidoreductase [Coraliomargarita sinensis]|uniref:Oxidoreductase n=1 Tax=Coraliomargarita sinensis TaxID=2174842 RepID=A0A317ZF28_9BACT|nr:Gfo/Idh/MocA family oxidoreductase [Coraliomargarita sinensis]PXA04026.1 oxidoreductase [Coraliomargarita sinensis]